MEFKITIGRLSMCDALFSIELTFQNLGSESYLMFLGPKPET